MQPHSNGIDAGKTVEREAAMQQFKQLATRALDEHGNRGILMVCEAMESAFGSDFFTECSKCNGGKTVTGGQKCARCFGKGRVYVKDVYNDFAAAIEKENDVYLKDVYNDCVAAVEKGNDDTDV